MTGEVLTLAGPPGSGKSTAGRIAAASLRLQFVSAGDLFRSAAAERGMDLAAFSAYAESHPEVDMAVDERMLALARPDRLLDGRITGHLLRIRGRAAVCVLVTAQAPIRYARIAQRDGLGLPRAQSLTKAREESERKRYAELYAIDLSRESADLVIDSSEIGAAAVADRICELARQHGIGR